MAGPLFENLKSACETGNQEEVKTLVPSQISGDGPNAQVSPLHICARKGYTDIGEYLIKYGKASMKRRDKMTDSPLHYAAKYGHGNFVKMLIGLGCDVNIKGLEMSTPFHYAAESNNETTFCILLEHNAKLLIENKKGKTPLNLALSSEFYGDRPVNPVILRALFEKYPEETYQRIRDIYEKGWPHKRYHDKSVGKILMEIMPDYLQVVLQDIHPLSKPHINDLLDMGWNVKLFNNAGESTLHVAIGGHVKYITYNGCYLGSKDYPWRDNVQPIVTRLIKLGVKVNAQNKKGETPLFLLCEASSKLDRDDSILKMLEFGADVNIGDNNGRKPLDFLVESGKTHCVLSTLRAGAKLDCLHVESVLNLSVPLLNLQCIKFLLTAGYKIDHINKTHNKEVKAKLEDTILRTMDYSLFMHECGYNFENNLKEFNYNDSLNKISSLKSRSSRVIRENLYPNAWVGVGKLELPTYLKKMITFDHELFFHPISSLVTELLAPKI